MHKKCVLLVGLPSAGKSSYIAALYHIVEQGLVSESLQLKSMFGQNSQYLHDLGKSWLSGIKLGRTQIPDERVATLSLVDPSSGQEIELHIPDMSGETFAEQWERRLCTKEYLDLLNEVTGLLLFINPMNLKEPARITTGSILAAGLRGDPSDLARQSTLSSGNDLQTQGKPAKEWSPKGAPTQVKLVEILQFIRCVADKKFKVAVIISAWDLLYNHGNTPAEVLIKRLPLLYQYLSANAPSLEYKVYGVSALGGDLEHDRERLLKKIPSERVIVVDEDGESRDISRPLKWLWS